jgi:hypothetical protein
MREAMGWARLVLTSRFAAHTLPAQQPLVFQVRIAVRHAGQVITDGPGPSIPPGTLSGQATNLLVVLEVALEEFFQQAPRMKVRLVDDGIVV